MKARIYLVEAKQQPILKGHPWVFPKAIATIKGTPKTGELVEIFTHDSVYVGLGVYNEHSLYRIRVLYYAFENLPINSFKDLIFNRLSQAVRLRLLINLPNEETNAYRLFNSEADGLSGLTVDRFNEVVVISSSAYWVEVQKNAIIESLQTLIPDVTCVWLSNAKTLAQDGFEGVDSNPTACHTQILENGILYDVDFLTSQKTGLFLDQRENHARIANIARDKRVLDLYCYTGGFALNAAKGQATSVTAVDSSKEAIAKAQKNAALNGFDSIDFIVDDARNYLAKAGDYDLIILDPPKLVPSSKYLQRAKNYYRFLHRELFKAMRQETFLMTCNCSSALSLEEFKNLVHQQAILSGKLVRMIGVFGPASCHPTLSSFPEGNYLTAILLAVT